MIVERRNRNKGNGYQVVKTKKRLPISFDLASLNLMCNYVLSENRNIKRGQYINLRNLVEMLDLDKYVNDSEKMKRINFIKKGIEARLIRGLTKPTAIVKYINGGILDDDVIDIDQFIGMSNAEIDWINETVSQSLSSAFIYENIDYYIDLFMRFKTADYTSISAITKEIEVAIAALNTQFRKNKIESATERVFSLKPMDLRNVLEDIFAEINSEYRYLNTGMQGMNQILGGGFENTRLYLLLGMTGVGKSMTLLDLAYQIKKYNKNFKAKDPTKTPCVVYLTMENSVTETVQRLFEMATGNNMRGISVDQLEHMLRTEGELYLTGESPVDIIIKFKPNRSVDTSYMYTLTEDLEDEGYEVICFLQDHIKRIRSVNSHTDIRLELGDVTNEMKTFAMIKDIPVITVSHLNRDGARTLDDQMIKGKGDLTRLLGKANIGESFLMLDNADWVGIINKEYDENGTPYICIKNIKTRIRLLREYICQPYRSKDSNNLMEDFYSMVPVFKDTLTNHDNMVMVNNTKTKVAKSNYTANLKILDDDLEDNIYKNASIYSDEDEVIGVTNTPLLPKEPIFVETDEGMKELKSPILYYSSAIKIN